MATSTPAAAAAGAAASQPSTSAPPSQEYIVRVSRDVKKKHSILKFNPANNVDFTKGAKATLERENNYKEFKHAYNIDAQPKFGLGSEFGREAREEARRKKYGIKSKVYLPDSQPWTMKLGNDPKTARKFKGIKEGGVLENASYYIFTQCPDGAFEAFPINEWYNFTPIAKYRVLDSEEAEKEFERREERHNYFNIMVRKRMKGDDDDGKEVDDDGKKVKKSKKKDFWLTELEEWAILSDGSADEESEGSGEEKKEKKEKKKEKKDKKKKAKKSSKKKRRNSDSEAGEDSDDLDEGKEVDYMTSSDSDDNDMYADTSKMKSDKFDDKGVVDEDGLRKLFNSDDEEDDENEKKNEEEDKEEEEEEKKEEKKKKGTGSDSESSSSSESDSDVEKNTNFSSAVFLKKSDNKPGSKKDKPKSKETTPSNSRSATPTTTATADDEKTKKRKATETEGPVVKKPRVSTPTPTGATASSASDGITEELVRRYLLRKPMTTKELLIKFRNTGLSKEQRVTQLAQILKKLNPDKKKIQDQLYLSIKKAE